MAYAIAEDLGRFGVAIEAIASIPAPDLAAQLEAASQVADSYIRSRVTLPLHAPYPLDLVQAVCKIAIAEAMPVRGIAPEVQEDFSNRRREAMDWLKDIAAGTATPSWIDSSADAAVGYDGPYVVTPEVASTTLRGL